MMDNVIRVEHLWKQYGLGSLDARSLKEEVHHWWRRSVLGSPVRAVADNQLDAGPARGTFWALQDIDFTLRQGEVLGIVGKNGAGKSTLLKLLSRVTQPTRGRIRGRGRVASLLEVGTGFHPELSGRENIFLNGNILGMSNREVKRKFDEIVDFSGISRFLDTPVKRYSSGMYVRLAFAVAAHLEPEILIVDEVLAVGDSEFQDRCLDKMQEVVSSRGCTVLYVSHNLPSVLQLCQRALLLKEGRLVMDGAPAVVVRAYREQHGRPRFQQAWRRDQAPGNDLIRMREVSLETGDGSPLADADVRTPLEIRFRFQNAAPMNLSVGVHLFTMRGECIFDVTSPCRSAGAGEFSGSCRIPGHFLNDGGYYVSIIFVRDTMEQVYYLENCLRFEVADYRGSIRWKGKWIGAVRPDFPVHIRPLGRKPVCA